MALEENICYKLLYLSSKIKSAVWQTLGISTPSSGLKYGLAQFFGYQYLLLTEFAVRTVSYGPSFSPSIYGASTDREDDVSKIFIISLLCVWRVRERFLFTRNGLKFLTHVESKTSQFEIVVKSLARL